MVKLEELVRVLADQHPHLCPKQVLGVRMGLLAGKLLGFELPVRSKRLFVFVETDGCFVDGVSVAAGCNVGHRTLRVMDYGKVAATFVDTHSGRSIRIRPHRASRLSALEYAPGAPDRWHAQLEAYQIMPDEGLLQWTPVTLSIDLQAIISRHGHRVVCAECGEDIINEREVRTEGQILCRGCAAGAYYQTNETPAPVERKLIFEISKVMAALPSG